jgi:hypothetical protein
MSRRTVRVELDRRSAVVTGPRLDLALRRSAARWHWHEHSRHRAVRVHLDDLDDLLVALEVDGQLVELLDRDGRPVPIGGLLGGVA